MFMTRSLERVKQTVAKWLRQGVSPRRLALTLALGFAIGCVPVIGIPYCGAVMPEMNAGGIPAIEAAPPELPAPPGPPAPAGPQAMGMPP